MAIGFHVFDHLFPGICSADSVRCNFHIALKCFQSCFGVVPEVSINIHIEHGLEHRYRRTFTAFLDYRKLKFNLVGQCYGALGGACCIFHCGSSFHICCSLLHKFRPATFCLNSTRAVLSGSIVVAFQMICSPAVLF